ncbi:MAG: hypothetical protein BM485_02295 [Desulfobulbaceae bacterium DB1]|nr:MAG: hypothetical protein BM485_02295 [Desulfobulbaceae bacterium DB1]
MLEYAGAKNVSYLNRGIEGRHEAGYHTSDEEAEPKAVTFGGKPGITPDKTVVTTCSTGQPAGSAYFMFRYLGYDNVKVHNASWISWCAAE